MNFQRPSFILSADLGRGSAREDSFGGRDMLCVVRFIVVVSSFVFDLLFDSLLSFRLSSSICCPSFFRDE